MEPRNRTYANTYVRTQVVFADQTGQKIAWIGAKPDPGVVEVVASPFTIEDLDTFMGDILELSLFTASKKSGFSRTTFGGEEHIHIDFDSLFREEASAGSIDYLLFRNYIVDWVNHNELYWGGLHYDPKARGATPLLQEASHRKSFEIWLRDYDELLDNGTMTPEEFTNLLKYLKNVCGFRAGSALNIIGLKGKTIEIRCSKNKKDMKQLRRFLILLQTRANYLKNYRKKLPYYRADAIQSAQEGVNRFYRYLKESNLSWNEYSSLLTYNWQFLKPQDLPDEKLFPSTGKHTPGRLFKCVTRGLIHLLGF